MKVITNEDLIAKRKKWAGILAPLAMLLLLGGLGLNLLSLRSESINTMYFYGTLALLLVGFVTSTISSGLVNKWVKEPRADQILGKALKGFDNRYVLFNYTTKVSHVMVTHNKLFTITAKSQDGTVSVNGNKWRRKFSLGRIIRFFADEGLGNPTFDAQHDGRTLQKLLDKKLPDIGEVPIQPVVLFTNPAIDLTVENPDVPVMKSNKFKNMLRESTSGAAISADVRKQIIELLSL